MPEYHPNELPGLLQYETPVDLGSRAELHKEKHIQYIVSFGKVRKMTWRSNLALEMITPWISPFRLLGALLTTGSASPQHGHDVIDDYLLSMAHCSLPTIEAL
jgi:hypothetical protein